MGDRIALLAPNCIEYPELVCGLSDAGAIVATLNPRSSTEEIRAACDDCGARALFVHPSLAGMASATGHERIVLLDDEFETSLMRSSPVEPHAEISELDPFTLVYSSGTTGRPKGILISHRARTLLFHAMAMEYGCYGPDDLQLGLAPMAHGAGFAFIMATLWFGGTVEILTRFDPEQVIGKLASEPITGIFMVPTHFQSIFALSPRILELHRSGATALKTIISNAAPLPQAMKEKIVAYWGDDRLHETYGSTEAGIVTNLRPSQQLVRKQSVGLPFATNRVKLFDEKHCEVGPNEVGELFSWSPYLFEGYLGQPSETESAMYQGWVTAGDLARRDEDGFLYIVDRKKDMIISGGINIYPAEIEIILAEHPEVLEAAVVGVTDERWGERLQAFVVIRPQSSLSADELLQYCRRRVASYKVPKELRFISALPRNPSGKLLKKALRELA